MNFASFASFALDFFRKAVIAFSEVFYFFAETRTFPDGSSFTLFELMFSFGLPFFLLWTFLIWFVNIAT